MHFLKYYKLNSKSIKHAVEALISELTAFPRMTLPNLILPECIWLKNYYL